MANHIRDTKQMQCRVCGHAPVTLFDEGRLFDDIDVSYYDCGHCGYVQTETPYWLDRAYTEAINDSDTGIMSRNQGNARVVLGTMLMLNRLSGTLVDFAGGYGILVRLLRDYGINALWSDQYCANLVARGFAHNNEPADLVTAFEAFEHFVSPTEELDRLLKIAPNVLLSTYLIADPAPSQKEWWYYGKEHGQHIGFFRVRTLEKLAKERSKFFVTDGLAYHLISDKKISPLIWKILIKFNRFVPPFVRSRLVSKTWADHLTNAAQQKK